MLGVAVVSTFLVRHTWLRRGVTASSRRSRISRRGGTSLCLKSNSDTSREITCCNQQSRQCTYSRTETLSKAELSYNLNLLSRYRRASCKRPTNSDSESRGISSATEELLTSLVMFGWSRESTNCDSVFESQIDNCISTQYFQPETR